MKKKNDCTLLLRAEILPIYEHPAICRPTEPLNNIVTGAAHFKLCTTLVTGAGTCQYGVDFRLR